jgi:hypothetical protein
MTRAVPHCVAELRQVRKCWTSARAAGSICCLGPSSRRDRVRLWRRNDRRDIPTLPRDNASEPGRHKRRVPQGHDRRHPAAGWIGGRGDQQLRDQPVGHNPKVISEIFRVLSPTPWSVPAPRNPYKSPDRLAAQLENAQPHRRRRRRRPCRWPGSIRAGARSPTGERVRSSARPTRSVSGRAGEI